MPGVGVTDGSTISNGVDTPVVGGFKYGTTSAFGTGTALAVIAQRGLHHAVAHRHQPGHGQRAGRRATQTLTVPDTFNHCSSSARHHISGNALTVPRGQHAGGSNNLAASTPLLAAPIVNGVQAATEEIVFTNNGTLTLNAPLYNLTTGGLTIAGAGTLALPNANVSTGVTSTTAPRRRLWLYLRRHLRHDLQPTGYGRNDGPGHVHGGRHRGDDHHDHQPRQRLRDGADDHVYRRRPGHGHRHRG